MLENLLPWAKTQRWFHSDWPMAGWTDAYVYQLDHSAILVARPTADGPWLQLPVVDGADGTPRPEFWRDWLDLAGTTAQLLSVEEMGREQSNSSVILHTTRGSWVTKLYRVVFPGDNPDVVLPLRLMEAGFPAVAPVRAYLHLPEPDGKATLISGVATELIEDASTARDYFISLAKDDRSGEADARDLGFLLGQMQNALPPTGEMAPPALLSRRLESVYLGARSAIDSSESDAVLPPLAGLLEEAERVSAGAPLSPIHGDLHLEQILRSPDGQWTFIDFEGEPLRTLEERLAPDFPLRDLAGLLRSFDYAAHFNPSWVTASQDACRAGYERAIGRPIDEELLRLLMIEKALYEVTYEATYRPGWLWIPLRVFK